MKKERVLEILRNARPILVTSYVPFIADDRQGGHCVAGCVSKGAGHISGNWPDMTVLRFLDAHARALHPECAGAVLPRPERYTWEGCVSFDKFDSFPAIFVNNHLGKEAVLQVVDSAILELETRLAVPSDEKKEETATVGLTEHAMMSL
jgi:hypothetical protein